MKRITKLIKDYFELILAITASLLVIFLLYAICYTLNVIQIKHWTWLPTFLTALVIFGISIGGAVLCWSKWLEHIGYKKDGQDVWM